MTAWLGAHWGRLALVAVWLFLIWDTPRKAWYCMVAIAAGFALFALAGLSLVPIWLDIPALVLGIGGRVWATRVTQRRFAAAPSPSEVDPRAGEIDSGAGTVDSHTGSADS